MATVEVDLNHRVLSIFENLRRSLTGLVAVGLGDANGLPIAFSGPMAEKEATTAMASLLVSAAARAVQALGLPAVRDVVIDTEGSNVLVHPIGDRFTLVVIVNAAANVGYAKLLAGTCSDDIRIALEGA